MLLRKPYFLIFLTVLLLSGCGAFHAKIGQSSSQVKFSLFVRQVKPLLKSNCFGCHAQANGAAGTGFFMHPNDDLALFSESSKRIVDNHPESSLLLQKGMNQITHQGGNQLPTLAEQDTIRNWVMNVDTSTGSDSGGGSPVPSNLKWTSSVQVPSALTLNGAYKYMRFNLSGLGHPNAFIEMGIRYYTEGGYEFSQWRVYAPNYPLTVSGLNIVVSDGVTTNSTNTLSSVVLTANQSLTNDANSNPLPGAVLSTRSAVGVESSLGLDQIKLGFTNVIRATGGGSNTEQTVFFSSVKPVLMTNCHSCHSNTGGFGNFNMPDNNDTLLYQNVRSRVTAKDPTNSRLYQKGTGIGHNPGNKLPLQADRDAIVNWINMIQ